MKTVSIHLLVAVAFLTATIGSHAAVTAGGLAVVGYDDNEDFVTLVATEKIQAGEVIYLTNNGWSSSQSKFYGADPSQGAGNESLLMLTITSTINPGTLLSTAASGTGWTWTTSGVIPGQAGGSAEFSGLALEYTSDQIYIFQAGTSNPLLNPTNFIYAMHIGNVENPTFSDAEDERSGDLPPGLSLAAGTAFVQANLNAHGDADGNNSAWGLNLSSSGVSSLQLSTGTKSDWLAAISDSSNWGTGIPAPASGTLAIHAPEPSRGLLVLGAGVAVWLRRRR